MNESFIAEPVPSGGSTGESRGEQAAGLPRTDSAGAEGRCPWPPSFAIGALVIALGTYGVMLGDGHTIFAFAGKEQLFEHLSAWLFLLSSLLSLGCWLASRGGGVGGPRRGWLLPLAYGVLALFFFVAFGEELSWGQHYFGFATPEQLEGLNQQKELNLHNLSFIDSNAEGGKRTDLLGKLLNSNRLFDYFMIGLFLLVPLAHRVSPWARRWIDTLGAPRMALVLASPLILNWVLSIASERWLVHNEFRHMATSEIRELNYAVLCALGMGTLYLAERRSRVTRHRGARGRGW